MLHLGILKTFDSENHKAGVQLAGSLTTYLDDIAVATNIAPEAMTIGNYVLVAIPGGNPRDACIVASWPQGSSGGGGGAKIQDADGDTYLWVEKTADEDKIHGVVKGVEAFLLNDAGVLTLAKQSGATGYKSTGAGGQTIAHATITKVTLDSEEFDLQNEFDSTTNYRFTAKTAGLYLILGQVRYNAPTVDQKRYQCRFHKDGANWQIFTVYASGTGVMTVNNMAIAFLAVDDYIELYTYQDSGANAVVQSWDHQTFLTVVKIA